MPYAESFGVQIPNTGVGLLDAILRMIRQDAFGGLQVSPASYIPAVSQMEQELPRLLMALSRRPESILFSRMDPSELSAMGGKAMTRFIPPTDPSRLRGMTQMLFSQYPESVSLAHEGLHALYGANQPTPPPQYAQRILEFLVSNPMRREALLGKYSQNVPHAALAAMAENMVKRAGTGLSYWTAP